MSKKTELAALGRLDMGGGLAALGQLADMVGLAPGSPEGAVAAKIGADLRLLRKIQSALGTAESGEALVAVARDAHRAEQELAAQRQMERDCGISAEAALVDVLRAAVSDIYREVTPERLADLGIEGRACDAICGLYEGLSARIARGEVL